MTGGRLRRPAACSTPSLVPYTLIILANLHFAAAGDGESDSEFAFNVFTDLAPLLALFGEQFARQFMSESLTWLDHIIFAMAPLGIVTAIVGAIRVSGPAWARAFIGRARESRAAAEIELMSSTSREVCEVYNGKGVVRAMGTPKLTQFILFPAQYRNRDDTCGIHTLKTAYERSQPYLEKGKYGVKTDWSTSKKQEDWQLGTAFGAGLAMGVGTNVCINLKDEHGRAGTTKAGKDKGKALIDPTLGITGVRRRLWGNGKSKPADVENPRALELYVDRPKAPSFPLELEGSAPNLQLNLPSSISSHKSTIKDLWCAALFAILVQEAVLVISAVTTFHPATRRAIGPPQTDYGFWMFIAGTICLNLGMILCSFVIEQSTREWSWRKAASQEEQLPGTTKEANLASHPATSTDNNVHSKDVPGFDIKTQAKSLPSATVKPTAQSQSSSASNHMDAVSHSTPPKSTALLKRLFRRRRHPDPSASLQLFWLQQKHTVNDQDFEPFLILGGPKDEILTSSRDLDYDSWSPVWGKPIPKWIEKIVANKYEFVTIWASLFGLIGFMLQFEGLRGLTWPTAVSQLLAIFVVALIRAIVRRRLGKSPSAVRAHGGHELDWLTLRLVYEDDALLAHSNPGDPLPLKIHTRWRVLTRLDLTNLSTEKDSRLLVKRGELLSVQGPVSLPHQRVVNQPAQNPNRLYPQASQMAVNVRRRLGKLARCPGPASQEAIALAQAISLVLTDLCPIQDDHEEIFTWSLRTMMEKISEALHSSIRPKPSRRSTNVFVSRTAMNKGSGEIPEDTSDSAETDLDLVTLQAHGDKGGWKMHPSSLDAILSLWMSSLAKSGQAVGVNGISHGESKARDDDAEDVEIGTWLSQMASATVKYRRVLGENPAPYESITMVKGSNLIRTDILTRDLNWWTSDPRITATKGESDDSLDTRNVTLEIGFNGLKVEPEKQTNGNKNAALESKKLTSSQEPDPTESGESRPKVVSIVSNGPLATVLSHHLFSAFMWAVSDHVQEDRIDTATAEDAELFDSSEFLHTWNIPTLRNKRLMKLARAITGFGMGLIDDVLLGIIPPLSHRGILPNEAMMSVLLTKAREHEKYHDWDQAQKAYRHLMDLPLHPKRMDRISYEVVVEIVEFLYLTGDAVADLNVMLGSQVDVSEQGRSLREAEKAVTESLQAHDLLFKKFEELRWFYYKQRRGNKYERLYQSLKTVQRKRADAAGQKQHNLSRTTNEGTGKSENSAQLGPRPDYRLQRLTKFTARHVKASRWNKDRTPLERTAEHEEAGKQDIFGWYPLHYATVSDDYAVFKDILKGCTDRAQHELKDRSGRTPLHYAALYYSDKVKEFISNKEKGKSAANARGRDGTLPIHCASRSGKMDSVVELSRYSTPAPWDAFNRSPLHLGVIIRNKHVVEHFSREESLATIPTGEELLGRTALHMALVFSKDKKDSETEIQEIVERLTAREKDLRALTIVDEVKASPIIWMLESKDKELLKTMLAKLSKVEWRQRDDGESNVSTECFKNILYEAIRLKHAFALELVFGLIKDRKLEKDWVKDAFGRARKLGRDDMLLAMFSIVKSLIPDSNLEPKNTASEVGTKTSPNVRTDTAPLLTTQIREDRVEDREAEPAEPERKGGSGHSSPFSNKFLKELETEFGNEIETNLRQFIRTGDFSAADKLLEDKTVAEYIADIDWNQKDSGGKSGLAYISKLGLSSEEREKTRIQTLESLWKPWSLDERKKALDERQGRYNKTPLIYAVRNGLLEVAELFLKNKAHVGLLDTHQDSAIIYAIRGDHSRVAFCKLLIEHDPGIVNEKAGSWEVIPLIEAIRNGRSDVLDLLSSSNPPVTQETNPNLKDREGDAALAWCYWQWPSMIKTLSEKFPKVDPHQRNNEGASPLMVAYRDAVYNDDIADAIRDMFKVAKPSMKGYEGTLMLSHAIYAKDDKLVGFLLDAGADPCSSDDAGRQQIELAALHGSLTIFKMLCKIDKVARQKEVMKHIYHRCIQYTGGQSETILREMFQRGIMTSKLEYDRNGWSLLDCARYAGNEGKLDSMLKDILQPDPSPFLPPIPSIRGLPKDSIPSPLSASAPPPLKLPSSWARRVDNTFLRISDNTLELVEPYPRKLPLHHHSGSMVLIRTDYCIPFNRSEYYWELEIMQYPNNTCVAIGVCGPNSAFHCLPGWSGTGSIGYHSDDGIIRCKENERLRHEGEEFGAGDTVGCMLTHKKSERSVQFFLKREVDNEGKKVDLPPVKIGPLISIGNVLGSQLYPCVGINTGVDSLHVKVQGRFDVQPGLPEDPNCDTHTDSGSLAVEGQEQEADGTEKSTTNDPSPDEGTTGVAHVADAEVAPEASTSQEEATAGQDPTSEVTMNDLNVQQQPQTATASTSQEEAITGQDPTSEAMTNDPNAQQPPQTATERAPSTEGGEVTSRDQENILVGQESRPEEEHGEDWTAHLQESSPVQDISHPDVEHGQADLGPQNQGIAEGELEIRGHEERAQVQVEGQEEAHETAGDAHEDAK